MEWIDGLDRWIRSMIADNMVQERAINIFRAYVS